jgi:hypothetical protein
LADDSVALDATAENARRAARNFQMHASQTSNMSGFAQRSMKQSFRGAANLETESAVADAMSMAAPPVASSRRLGAATGGSRFPTPRGARLSASKARASLARSNAEVDDFVALADDSEVAEESSSSPRETVRTIAGKTFYFKEGRWIDAALDKESQTARTPVVVEQFSDAYFELVGRLGREFSQYLAFNEALTFLFDGQVYQIEPSKTNNN